MTLNAEVIGAAELAALGTEPLGHLGQVARTPWETPEWLIAAASSFPSWSPRAVVVSDGNAIVAAVVVGSPHRSRTAPLRVVADMDICEPTDIPAGSRAAADVLARALLGLGRPLLPSRVAPGSLLAEALLSQTGRRGVVRTRPSAATPVCAFRLPPPRSTGDYNDEWHREVIRRAEKKVAIQTSVERPSVGRAPHVYNEFLRMEASGWKGRAGTAVACRPEVDAFYFQYLTAMSRSGRLWVTNVVFDGEPAAIEVSVVIANRLWGMKGARNERFDKHSPGLVQLRATILAAHAAGLEAYEHCGVYEDWLRPWSNESRQYVQIRAYPLATYGAAALARQGALSLQARARRVVKVSRAD